MTEASKATVLVATIIAESKLRRRVDFRKMHPRERDYWYARAAQAFLGDAHQWALVEAHKRVTEGNP
jgi:hypothetical protein